MGNVFFSVITVCYNSAKTIEQTFLSILKQSFLDTFEYIVIDGASNDGTVELIKKYEEKFNNRNIRFKWVSEKDTGIYNAMNKGLKIASGEYIGILNSDDYYTEDALSDVKNAFDTQMKADVYHGLMRFIHNGEVTMIRGMSDSRLNVGMFEHPTCFVAKRVYKLYGGFNEKYKYIADYELMLRLKEKNLKFYLIESIIANFDEDGAGNSYKSRMELAKFRKEKKYDSSLKFLFKVIKISISELKRK